MNKYRRRHTYRIFALVCVALICLACAATLLGVPWEYAGIIAGGFPAAYLTGWNHGRALTARTTHRHTGNPQQPVNMQWSPVSGWKPLEKISPYPPEIREP